MTELIKILLIEDDAVDKIFFERALKAADVNAELVVSEDAESGIIDFCNGDFSCVFLDYMLPGTDGLSLLKKLHAQKAGVPIVLITSHGDEKIAVNAMKAGAMDYIPKNLITPLSLGQIIRNIIRFKEIEKQKIAAENIVKQSEKRHRIFFEKSQIFLCTHDLEGNFINVNFAGAKSLGYEPEELIGTNLTKIVHTSWEQSLSDYLKNILRDKTAMGLMRVDTKSGEERIWMYHNYLYEETGHESYVIGSIQDITERVRMEEEMRQARQLAEESVKTKEQFLANMSHEIRTPMSAIIGFTNLILETKLDKDQKDYLDTINYSARNLLSIINDILDFSKIKSGKLILEEANFDLSKVVNSLAGIFRLETNKKKIDLICTIDPAVPLLLKGDSVRLNQILMNLVSNAVKFTDSGYIKLEVKLSSRNNDHSRIEFSVEDSGIGIPADKLESVFESFTQASSDTTRKYGGTGLGLAIVKDLVEIHGGEIKAVRNAGPGTRFSFTVPLKDGVPVSKNENAYETGKSEEGKYRNLKGARILIAEDNKINQQLAKVVLHKMGCEVDIAENGREAIEKLEGSRYDIILMDIQMPELDGYEATRYIRTLPDAAINKIPIIAMTAHALNDEGAKCIQAGMNDYISKPFEKEILYSKISDHLQRAAKPSPQPELDKTPGSENFPAEQELNLAYLKEVLGDSDEALLEVLLVMDKEFPGMTENIKIAGSTENWKQLKEDAHKMKSSVMMLGMPQFESLIQCIERYAYEESHLDTLPGLVKQAVSLCHSVIAQVKAELEKLKAEAGSDQAA
jgi:PAS domain S-box-containing protein